MLDELAEYHDLIASCSQGLAADVTGSRSHLLNNRGLAYAEIGRMEEGDRDLSAAVEADPSNSVAWLNRGDVRKKMGRLVEAGDDYRQATLCDPGNPTTFANLGYMELTLARFAEAVGTFSAAIALRPLQPYLQARARAYQQLGQAELAQADLERAERAPRW